jgi:hypothetical protein
VDAAAAAVHQAVEEVDHDRGREAGGVGVDQEEQRPVAQHLLALVEQVPEVVLKLPHLAGAAAPEGRRVHDDGVVLAAALDLAAHEFHAVVGDVADGRLGQAGEHGVLLAPLHHALGGVHVAHARAGVGGGDGCCAGIAEQVEHAHLAAGGARVPDLPGKPVPVHGLFGEEAGVLEARGVDLEGEVAVPHGPVLGELLAVFPLAAAGLAAVVEAVPVGPGLAAGLGPDDLGVGAHEVVAAPLLLLHAVAAVEQAVVLPAVGDDEARAFDEHGRK